MKVGILEFRDTNGRYLPVLEAYEKILAHNGIPFERLRASQADFLERARGMSFLLVRWGHYDHDRQLAQALLPVVDRQLRLPCYPDWNTCWHYDDKIRQWLLTRARGYPMVESRVFWEQEEALAWLEREAEFPRCSSWRSAPARPMSCWWRTPLMGKNWYEGCSAGGSFPAPL